MASQARRISRSPLLLISLLIPILIVAVLLEPFIFARSTHVLAWTPMPKQPMQWVGGLGGRIESGWSQPVFQESKTGAIPLLLIESTPMDPAARERRRVLLRQKLAEQHMGPLLLVISDIPEASLVQKALHLQKLPARCHVVLEISLLDLIREERGSWGGYSLPLLEATDGQIDISWPKDIHAASPFPPSILRLPYVQWLWEQPLLETRHGSFPSALWPLRRNGAPKESTRYAKLDRALRYWKQKLDALQGKLVIVYLPLPIETDPKQLAWELEALGLDSKQLESSRAGRMLRDLCQQLDLSFVNPTRLLRSAAKKKRPLFDDRAAAPFVSRYTPRAEKIILGFAVRQAIQPLFK